MKILFIARASLYKNRGGDTIQLLKTAESLDKLGVAVDIRLADEAIAYAGYDLLHFSNLMRPADILRHAVASGKPYVVSPLFVDYSEADRHTRRGLAKLMLRLIPPDGIEYLKVISRRLLNGERIVSRGYWWYGQRGSVRRILRDAAMLLPNSENEYLRLWRRYKIDRPYRVIPNAIDPDLFSPGPEHLSPDPGHPSPEPKPLSPDPGHPSPEPEPLSPAGPYVEREKDLVLCAARIEGIKNQLNLIRAVNGSPFRLILVGAPATNQQAYFNECRKTAGPAVTFVDSVPQEELAAYYRRAQVHALPSWFETTGLSSLEAAAMGCAFVITDRGDTREYFGDHAFYCDPASPASILEALTKAAGAGPAESLRTKILEQYTWSHAAAETLAAYQTVLARTFPTTISSG
jgi:glycosyltransferase involved in cell wall biosynthesis